MIVTVALCAGLTACQPARLGAKCRTSDFGDDGGAWVLRCVNGRWQRSVTKGQAAQFLIALKNSATTTAPPPTTTIPPAPTTTAAPAPPPAPTAADLRLQAMVQTVYGPTRWAAEVISTSWTADAQPGRHEPLAYVSCDYDVDPSHPGSPPTNIQTSAHFTIDTVQDSDQLLGDVVAHEGAHIVACHRWPETAAPPGWPNAVSGADRAESYADCLAISIRPDYNDSTSYGCPGGKLGSLPALAAQNATP